jgi:DNA-binding response OmpR family regulator
LATIATAGSEEELGASEKKHICDLHWAFSEMYFNPDERRPMRSNPFQTNTSYELIGRDPHSLEFFANDVMIHSDQTTVANSHRLVMSVNAAALNRAEHMATIPESAAQPRILLVDDSESVRQSLKMVLEHQSFQVTTAADVPEALHLIDEEPFDVLLSDLHMPGPGDGFTVVSAMRHKYPDAVTLLFTGYPALKEAMDAILLQADEILVKPMAIHDLVKLIRERLEKRENRRAANIERVASILERGAEATIADWLRRVEHDDELTTIELSCEERSGHLRKLLQEVVHRLRVPRNLGTKQVSVGAVEHGHIRRTQGYSIPMIIEESRMLQVSIFHTLQNNLSVVDFSLLLIDVMTIADEVDSQLKQTILSFSQPALELAV